MRQRVFGIACGYADCNDAARLADDPIHKLLLERDPLAGPGLGLAADALALRERRGPARRCYLASVALADTRHRAPSARGSRGGPAASRSTSIRPTTPPTASRSSRFFNGHYDTWCYLPLVATLTFNAEPTQYVVAAVLRPGNSAGHAGRDRRSCGACSRQLRAAFPGARSSGSGWTGALPAPSCFDFLEAEGVEYVVAMASNARLDKRSRRLMGRARMRVQGQRPDRAPLRRDALRRPEVEAQAAGHHQGRGRAASRPRSQEQSPLRGHQPGRRRRRRSTRSTAGGATWRTGSRSCITGWSWTGRVAIGSWPTSSGSC